MIFQNFQDYNTQHGNVYLRSKTALSGVAICSDVGKERCTKTGPSGFLNRQHTRGYLNYLEDYWPWAGGRLAAVGVLLLLFLTFSVLVANPKKLLYTVVDSARGLLSREVNAIGTQKA